MWALRITISLHIERRAGGTFVFVKPSLAKVLRHSSAPQWSFGQPSMPLRFPIRDARTLQLNSIPIALPHPRRERLPSNFRVQPRRRNLWGTDTSNGCWSSGGTETGNRQRGSTVRTAYSSETTRGFARLTARAELEKHRIVVSEIHPFIIATNFGNNRMGNPAGNGPSSNYAEGDKPEFIAKLVLQAVEEGQAQYSRMIAFAKWPASLRRCAPPVEDFRNQIHALWDPLNRFAAQRSVPHD